MKRTIRLSLIAAALAAVASHVLAQNVFGLDAGHARE